MPKKKTTPERSENGPKLKNATYGMLNDGSITTSIIIDVDNLAVSGIVYSVKTGKQYKFNAELKED